MAFLPIRTETLISKLPVEKIRGLLDHATAQRLSETKSTDKNKSFQGKIEGLNFLISRRIPTPNNFVPLIRGRIEPTKNGCILFLDYRLYRSAVMFLIFSLGMAFLVGILFLFIKSSYLYSLIAFCLGVINYLITLASFNRQFRLSRERLLDILNIEE